MVAPSKTMKVFEELLESPQNRLVEQAAKDGRIPIGYSCSFVPEALLMAGKLFPVRLHAPGLAGTEIADNYLSSFVCSYARGLLEFAMGGRFDLLQGDEKQAITGWMRKASALSPARWILGKG